MFTKWNLEANLLTSYNKLSPPGLGVLQAELLAQLQTAAKASYFAKIFGVFNIILFMIVIVG